MVDGHGAHGVDSRRAVNTDSSAARRRRYGHPVVSVPDSLSRSNATKWAGHSSGARAAPARRRASRFCNRSNAGRPAASHTTSSPSSAVASGSCAVPATTSGKAGPISVPRLERSTTLPASIETRACHLSYFGSPARPGSSAGSDTGAASIGSGGVHVTAHAFHPARPSANRVRVHTRPPARPRQVSAVQRLAGGCVLSPWRTSRQFSRTPGCPDPVSYGLMSRPPTVRNGSHRTRRCRRYGRKI